MTASLCAWTTVVCVSVPSLAHTQPLRRVEPWHAAKPAPRGDDLLRQAMLAAHNDARRARRAKALVWDSVLARDAMVYAQVLARTGRFGHDAQRGTRARQGENLFTGTRGGYSYDEMIGLMIAEGDDFRPGRFPDVSRTGRLSDVVHYTQIVWPTTTQLGCALASNRRDDYLVCRYLPAGNVMGVTLR